MIPRVLAQQICNPVLPRSIGCGSAAQGGIALGEIISNLISGMFILAFLIAFIYLMTGGFHWITSAGDKANLESARNKIIHALVGLIVVASVWAVALIAGKFVGLDIERLPIPSIGTRMGGQSNGGNQCGGCSGACSLEGQFCEQLTSQCNNHIRVVEVSQCIGGQYQFQYPQAGGTCYTQPCN